MPVGIAVQPLEGQERDAPLLTSEHRIVTDSGGPGEFRGGCGIRKGGTVLDADRSVMSYCSDRERAVTWGIEGGLPGAPHGVTLNRADEVGSRNVGTVFSGVPIETGDSFSRPSSGGGGYGDPTKRDPRSGPRGRY